MKSQELETPHLPRTNVSVRPGKLHSPDPALSTDEKSPNSFNCTEQTQPGKPIPSNIQPNTTMYVIEGNTYLLLLLVLLLLLLLCLCLDLDLERDRIRRFLSLLRDRDFFLSRLLLRWRLKHTPTTLTRALVSKCSLCLRTHTWDHHHRAKCIRQSGETAHYTGKCSRPEQVKV